VLISHHIRIAKLTFFKENWKWCLKVFFLRAVLLKCQRTTGIIFTNNPVLAKIHVLEFEAGKLPQLAINKYTGLN
jgi:hypothetical protein